MFIPSLPYIHFFHFSDTWYLSFNGSTKILESIVAFDSFLEGYSNIGSTLLCLFYTFLEGYSNIGSTVLCLFYTFLFCHDIIFQNCLSALLFYKMSL